MNKTGVIISGGALDRDFTLEQMKNINPEIIIGVDSGLDFLYQNAIMPTHIVGDFDSVKPEVIAHYKQKTDIPIREFNPVKDASDTEIAVRLAIELKVEVLWIFGATGSRLDHVWANVQTLKIAHDAGVKAFILDRYNRISMAEKQIELSRRNAFGPFFSVFSFGGNVQGLSISGAKYPLKNHTLCPYDSLTVSNQFLEDEVHITFSEGMIVLMETRDGKSAVTEYP